MDQTQDTIPSEGNGNILGTFPYCGSSLSSLYDSASLSSVSKTTSFVPLSGTTLQRSVPMRRSVAMGSVALGKVLRTREARRLGCGLRVLLESKETTDAIESFIEFVAPSTVMAIQVSRGDRRAHQAAWDLTRAFNSFGYDSPLVLEFARLFEDLLDAPFVGDMDTTAAKRGFRAIRESLSCMALAYNKVDYAPFPRKKIFALFLSQGCG